MSQKSLIDLFITFVGRNWQRILWLTGEHLLISLIAVGITVAICVPLGIYLTRNERAAPYVIGLANVFQTVPSLALLGFLIFVLGIGNDNAICALFLYAMLPVLQNTYTGIRGVPKSYVQAARGMGMTDFQILMKVQFPLALPVLVAGIRVTMVWTIGTATLASAIGGGGLGRLIFSGLSSIRNEIILAGAIPATLLALAADWLLKRAQEYFNPSARAKRLAKRHGISAETESNSAA